LHRSYFVEPENSGARAYVLLHDALERSGKVAVVQVALRQREALAVLRSRGGLLGWSAALAGRDSQPGLPVP